MALEQLVDKIIKTDVLVIGGGIAGCPAAIKAAEHGLDVTIVEKSKIERSGSAGQGIDHYGIFPRDGITKMELLRRWEAYQSRFNGDGRFGDPNIIYKYYDSAFWALEELEKMGIPMKWDDGEFYWMPHGRYGGVNRIMLRVHWQNIKPYMAGVLKESGVNVLNRIMIVDLLTNNDKIVGATAINTRTGEFIIIKAKAVIIATGLFARCYDPETPLFWKYKFRYHWCPATVSGDGWATAYRSGAELANMDITGWHFRARDDLTLSFGNLNLNDGIAGKFLTWKGEEFIFANAHKYHELEQNGKTPIYQTLEHLPDDYHKRMEVAYVDERLISFKIAEDRGFNPRTHWYELMPNKPLNFITASGISIDENFKASAKGLYAIGDCAAGFHSCGHAVVSGLLVGDSINTYVAEAGDLAVDEAQVKSQKQVALAPLAVKKGTEPMELECAIRYICERYVGQFKSEGKMREGLKRLASLRRVFLPSLMANNPHYLMRCLEVRNIMDLTEVHIKACLERMETRGNFIRLDYPEKDPSRDNMLTFQHIENGKMKLEIRQVPELKPEYARERK
ncbi:MAG TPA: FAD-dependent oxidoreductase [Dehalococcoidales bacterium]|nr:FAD-dependent oxidoreductase [Dehalococcoidales bacterium]